MAVMFEKGNVRFADIPKGAEFRFPRFHETDSNSLYMKTGYREYYDTYDYSYLLSTPNVMVVSPAL